MKRSTYQAPMMDITMVETENMLVLSGGEQTSAKVNPNKEVDAGNALSNQRSIWGDNESSRSLW